MDNPSTFKLDASKATVVSIFPFQINEIKPGLNPESYTIPAAAEKDISILHVENAVMSIYLGSEFKPTTRQIPENAGTIANALAWDFSRSQLEYNFGVAEPGLFAVDGHPSKEEIKKLYSTYIDRARTLQLKWFEMLVRLADTTWNKKKNHNEISDLQRYAAKRFGLKREWVIEYTEFNPQLVETK